MRFLAAIFRLFLALAALAASYLTWRSGQPYAWLSLEFQAELLLGLLAVWAGAATILKGVEPPAWLKGFTTIYVLLGALAAWGLTGVNGSSLLAEGSIGVLPLGLLRHVLLPVLAFLDFLLFDPHRRFPWHYTLSWMAYIPVYLLIVLSHAGVKAHYAAGGASTLPAGLYPYPGLDLPGLGWQQVGVNAAQYLVVAFGIGLLVFLIDRICPKRTALTI